MFSYDKLYVYQGNSADSLIEEHILTGALANLPMTFETYGSQIELRFVSDGGTNFPGFNLTYMAGKMLIF